MWRTFFRVTLPVCLPAVLDIAIYLFVNAMTTVSAVVFLYSPDTTLAAIAVLNMDDAGDIAPAAAMAMTIFLTSAVCPRRLCDIDPRLAAAHPGLAAALTAQRVFSQTENALLSYLPTGPWPT